MPVRILITHDEGPSVSLIECIRIFVYPLKRLVRRNNTNNSIGCLILGIVINIPCPNPLFFEAIIISICLGEIHLKSGTDLISA